MYDDVEKLWLDVVLRSPSAWYRHSYNLAEFHRCVAQGKNLEEHSFFILKNNEIIGLMPVLLMDNPNGLKEATYNGSPTPWPCFTGASNMRHAENFAFDHFVNICKEHGVDRSLIGLNAPSLKQDDANSSFLNLVKNHSFIDDSFLSHLALVDENSTANMRSSYRKKVRKFSKIYKASFHYKDTMSDDIEQAYFELHVKDAGGQFRPRKSYTKMADLARKGEAVFIVARNIETHKIAGVLVIAIFKNAAYDSSVSIDPEHHQDYISHILKVSAIRYLHDNGVQHYELGQVFDTASVSRTPSQKELNISFFKDGFARGITKKSFVAERCFTDAALKHKISTITHNLEHYFEIKT